MEEYIIWIGFALLILEFIGRVIPDNRLDGPLGYVIYGLKQLLILMGDVSDYLNRSSEDQKAWEHKENRFR